MIHESDLRKIPLLSKLQSAELESLSKLLAQRRVKRGTFILYAEDPGPSIMFIVEGKVKITLSSHDGKEVVLANLDEGDFFGEIALLTGEERSANVVAQTDCDLLILSAEDFHSHIMNNTGLVLEVARELARRLRNATSKIGDLALYDVYRRVGRTLKSIAVTVPGPDGSEQFIIEDRPTHQELASMVGTSREMVTRAMKGLEEEGCIVIDGKKIEVKKLPH